MRAAKCWRRITAGMKATDARGKHIGRPATPQRIVTEIEALATSTDLSIRQIQSKITGQAKRGRATQLVAL